ncbi:MAG: murein transglycosylase A [Pseudoruegeria sp.]
MGGAETSEAAEYSILGFEDLEGWAEDDHVAALSAFLETCKDLKAPVWSPLCKLARSNPSAQQFFEVFFKPVLIEDDRPMLFTGYFEPELDGSLVPTSRYRYPLYQTPPEAQVGPFASRREIEENALLAGRGLEIAWVDDPVELFFLQIQGSGRIRLTNGNTLRVGYGGKNGHNYRSIGQELVRQNIYQPHQVSAQVIKNWVRRNPVQGQELLWHNPSYVFFRRVKNIATHKGPLGAMNRSITTGRSIAVDPSYTPLGAPVWIEKKGQEPMNRLMIAQDTGSAIKGPQRADIFYGTGDGAGATAGKVRDTGRMVVLLPIPQAFDLVPEGEG